MSDIDVLETQVRAQAKEIRALKQTLLDQFAAAALTGLLVGGADGPEFLCTTAVPHAFAYAHMAMAMRERSIDELLELAVGPEVIANCNSDVLNFKRFLDPDLLLSVIREKRQKS